MAMENGYSLADIATATDRNAGLFGDGGGGMWIFALLILALIGGGGTFFGGAGNEAFTRSDILMDSNFNNLSRSVGEIADRQFTQATELTKGICELGYTEAQLANQTQKTIGDAFGALQNQLADCCCLTQRAIDSVKFDMANYASVIQANDTANTQKILDMLCQNKTEALQQRVAQLELQEAMCGVPKVSPFGYYMAPIPYAQGCGCGYNNAI